MASPVDTAAFDIAAWSGEPIRNQARTVADMVDNFGQWATRYRGVWVKDDPRDPKLQVGSFLEREASSTAAGGDSTMSNLAAFHRKNPALVQRDVEDGLVSAEAARTVYGVKG